jgi:ADP-heptose:LPS heptosyltransferase
LKLLDVPGINLYSLELHDQIEGTPDRFHQLGTEIVDFGDTAAIVQQLDLVISVDTALAHLALSFGCETWVVLGKMEDWRWVSYGANSASISTGTSYSGSIWYPKAKLYKQRKRRDWEGLMKEVAQALLK